jgi:hypothetical protein
VIASVSLVILAVRWWIYSGWLRRTSPAGFTPHWLDLTATLATGDLWLAAFAGEQAYPCAGTLRTFSAGRGCNPCKGADDDPVSADSHPPAFQDPKWISVLLVAALGLLLTFALLRRWKADEPTVEKGQKVI